MTDPSTRHDHSDTDRAAEKPAAVTGALANWLERPDVLADRFQTGPDGRVWTRAQDIVPGQQIREGQRVVAAWEDHTWTAIATWDPAELDILWLKPVGTRSDVPDPAQVYARSRAAVASVQFAALVDDYQQTVQLFVDLMRSHRGLAQDLLTALASVPANSRNRLLGSPTGHALLALARRTGVPRG